MRSSNVPAHTSSPSGHSDGSMSFRRRTWDVSPATTGPSTASDVPAHPRALYPSRRSHHQNRHAAQQQQQNGQSSGGRTERGQVAGAAADGDRARTGVEQWRDAMRDRRWDALPQWSYPVPGLSDDVVEESLANIQLTHQNLVPYCHTVMALILDQQSLFSPSLLQIVVKRLLDHVLVTESREDTVEIVRCLSFLVNEKAQDLHDLVGSLLEVLLPLLSTGQEDWLVRRLAVRCVGNVTAKSGFPVGGELQTRIFESLFANFVNVSAIYLQNSMQTEVSKLMAASCHALATVIAEAKDLHVAHVTTVVSLLRPLLFPKPVMSNTAVPGSDPYASMSALSSSASASEDSESGPRVRGIGATSLAEKVQLGALTLLQSMARAHRKSLYGSWPSLIPDHAGRSAQPYTPHLFFLILHHPSAKVRTAAVQVVTALLENARTYLAQADDRPPKANVRFTSSQQNLGAMVREIHLTVIYALNHFFSLSAPSGVPPVEEKFSRSGGVDFLVSLLRLVGTLASQCSYDKLHHPYLVELIACLSSLLPRCRNSASLVDALLVAVGSCLSQHHDAVHEYLASTSPSPLDYVIVLCPVRHEALLCMSKACTNYPDRCVIFWESAIRPIATSVLRNGAADQNIKILSLKVIGDLTHSLGLMWRHKQIQHSPPNSSVATIPRSSSSNDSLQAALMRYRGVWSSLVSEVLPLATDPSISVVPVRVAGLQIYSNLTDDVFLDLEAPQRQQICALVLDCARGGSPSTTTHSAAIRSAALRALGTLVSFPCLRHDDSLLQDCLNALTACLAPRLLPEPSPTPLVAASSALKARASWTLANLCEAVRMRKDFAQRPVLLEVALACMAEHDKVRTNIVRALGSLGSAMVVDRPEELGQVFGALCQCLAEGGVKVRWNSCYALGSIALHPGLVSFPDSTVLALVHRSCLDDNFKVKIQAANALASIAARSLVSEAVVVTVWASILDAIHQNMSRKLKHFAEYKYQKSLNERLARVFVHLCSVELDGNNSGLRSKIRSQIIASETMLLTYVDQVEMSSSSWLSNDSTASSGAAAGDTTGTTYWETNDGDDDDDEGDLEGCSAEATDGLSSGMDKLHLAGKKTDSIDGGTSGSPAGALDTMSRSFEKELHPLVMNAYHCLLVILDGPDYILTEPSVELSRTLRKRMHLC